jgi:Cu+-exporting ATPase
LFQRNIPTNQIHFNQTPIQKLEYIQKLQREGKKVCMIGDGLNDAGALAASDFGITITDDVNSFTPSSDAILDAKNLFSLPSLFRLSKESITIIKLSFLISFLYNAVGLSLAVSATLTPLFAAIFMPISSITIIVFVTAMVNWRGKVRLKL